MKDKDLLKLLQKHGWKIERIHGNHHILIKGDKMEIVTIQLPYI